RLRHSPPYHSVPTRRSSDLQLARPAAPPAAVPRLLVAMPQAVCKAARMHGSVTPEQMAMRLMMSQAHSAGSLLTSTDSPLINNLDRKSTRLNSSHGSIPYAV